jgi:hypothetical protein
MNGLNSFRAASVEIPAPESCEKTHAETDQASAYSD